MLRGLWLLENGLEAAVVVALPAATLLGDGEAANLGFVEQAREQSGVEMTPLLAAIFGGGMAEQRVVDGDEEVLAFALDR